MATVMAASGETTATINRNLTTAWRQEHGAHAPVPWDYAHLQYKFRATGSDLDIDFEGIMEHLDSRRDLDGLERFADYALGTNTLSRLFVELEGGKQDWAKGGEDNVILFDPTFGTNVYRIKLCLITTLCSSG